MSDFGPPPGAGDVPAPRRPPSYLPPGGRPSAVFSAAPAGSLADGGPVRYAVASHKPGIVPLRPLSASDLLDGATTLVRRNAGPVLALSALVNAAAVLPALLLLAVAAGWYSSSAASLVVEADLLAGLLLAGAPLAATAALTGLLGPLTADALLGHRPTLAEAWAAARPMTGAVLASAVVVLTVLVGPSLLAGAAVGFAASAPVPVVLAVLTLASLAAAVATLAALPRVALCGPAVTLERLGPGRAVRRAAALCRGRYWSTLGVGALAFGIGLVLFLALQVTAVVAGGLAADLLGVGGEQVGRLVTAAGTLLAATFVTPFLAGSVVLQYVDARMRTEGLDLVLRSATARGMAPR